jgi:hypothetical protein
LQSDGSFSDPDASGPVELLAWDSETIFRDQVLIEDCRPEWTKSVRKGVFILSAYKGAAGSSIPMGHILRIPMNCQADSLYAYFEKVEANRRSSPCECCLPQTVRHRLPGYLAIGRNDTQMPILGGRKLLRL